MVVGMECSFWVEGSGGVFGYQILQGFECYYFVGLGRCVVRGYFQVRVYQKVGIFLVRIQIQGLGVVLYSVNCRSFCMMFCLLFIKMRVLGQNFGRIRQQNRLKLNQNCLKCVIVQLGVSLRCFQGWVGYRKIVRQFWRIGQAF